MTKERPSIYHNNEDLNGAQRDTTALPSQNPMAWHQSALRDSPYNSSVGSGNLFRATPNYVKMHGKEATADVISTQVVRAHVEKIISRIKQDVSLSAKYQGWQTPLPTTDPILQCQYSTVSGFQNWEQETFPRVHSKLSSGWNYIPELYARRKSARQASLLGEAHQGMVSQYS